MFDFSGVPLLPLQLTISKHLREESNQSGRGIMSQNVLGIDIDLTSNKAATKAIQGWAQSDESRIVFFANVHMIMEAYDSPEFQEMVNAADLVTPDGMPLVWILHRMGLTNQERVSGYSLTLRVLEAAAASGIPVAFLGSSSSNLANLCVNIKERFPGLRIAYAYSPPFRALSEAADNAIISEIEESGARILFVGLGCPKQERWIFTHRKQIKAVMLGVGAVFEILGGSRSRAPKWMRRNGIEWIYRFWQEPKRLWKRYFFLNPRFIALTFRPFQRDKDGE